MVSIGSKWMIQLMYRFDNSKDVKKLINYSNIVAKHQIACVLIYYNKCQMQHVNNNFNILKVNGSIHVDMLIVEVM